MAAVVAGANALRRPTSPHIDTENIPKKFNPLPPTGFGWAAAKCGSQTLHSSSLAHSMVEGGIPSPATFLWAVGSTNSVNTERCLATNTSSPPTIPSKCGYTTSLLNNMPSGGTKLGKERQSLSIAGGETKNAHITSFGGCETSAFTGCNRVTEALQTAEVLQAPLSALDPGDCKAELAAAIWVAQDHVSPTASRSADLYSDHDSKMQPGVGCDSALPSSALLQTSRASVALSSSASEFAATPTERVQATTLPLVLAQAGGRPENVSAQTEAASGCPLIWVGIDGSKCQVNDLSGPENERAKAGDRTKVCCALGDSVAAWLPGAGGSPSLPNMLRRDPARISNTSPAPTADVCCSDHAVGVSELEATMVVDQEVLRKPVHVLRGGGEQSGRGQESCCSPPPTFPSSVSSSACRNGNGNVGSARKAPGPGSLVLRWAPMPATLRTASVSCRGPSSAPSEAGPLGAPGGQDQGQQITPRQCPRAGVLGLNGSK